MFYSILELVLDVYYCYGWEEYFEDILKIFRYLLKNNGLNKIIGWF